MSDLIQTVRQTHQTLLEQVDALRRQADEQLALAEQFQRSGGMSLEGLKAFVERPWLLRHIQADRYELIVPSFINLSAGWPDRVEGQYTIYQINRLVHMMTPLPGWLQQEVHYAPPEFLTALDGDRLTITEGDPSVAWAELGGKKNLSSRRGNDLFVKPGARFDVIRQLIRRGILPYQPQPIPAALFRKPLTDIVLRPHQQKDWEQFRRVGSMGIFATGGAGKTYFGLYAAAALTGDKLVLAPRRAVLDQWRMRFQAHCPQMLHEVEFQTYTALLTGRFAEDVKKRRKPYSLVIFDEAQALPANSGIAASTIKSVARLGLSATPWREDGQEDLILALSGFPAGHDWPSAPPPDTTVWVVDRPEEKAETIQKILSLRPRKPGDKTLIFVFRLAYGDELAGLLNVPFVNGNTYQPLQVVQEHDTVVISKVGDVGLSVNATCVIEADFLGGRTELGQRALRTRHAPEGGVFHCVMTKKEFNENHYRLAALFAIGADVKYAAA